MFYGLYSTARLHAVLKETTHTTCRFQQLIFAPIKLHKISESVSHKCIFKFKKAWKGAFLWYMRIIQPLFRHDKHIRRHFHVTIIRHSIMQKHFMKQWHNHTIQPEPGFIPLPCSELRQGRQYSGYIKSAARRFLKSRNARLRMPYGRDMKSWQVYINTCTEVWWPTGIKLRLHPQQSSV